MTSDHNDLLASQRPGFTLDQPFYCAESIFDADVSMLAGKWSLVEHVSRLPAPGDYVVVTMGNDSYIVVRGNDGNIRGFHNVCRHRGSRLCLEASGNSKRITCPYHAWTYDLEGALRGARDMGEDFDPDAYGLLPVGTRVLEGLIFLSPDGSETDFDSEYAAFGDLLNFHGIADAKVALRRHYPTDANWKLVVENFLECYHCVSAHPEYCQVHSPEKLRAFGAGPGSGDAESVERFQPKLDAWRERAEALGHPVPMDTGSPQSTHMAQFGRTPIGDGMLSETLDGEAASSLLMGRFEESDGGQTGFGFSPNGYLLANCDSAFLITFVPVSATYTDVVATWLVDGQAVEGQHYELPRLTEMWDATLRQDKTITENNQTGISSRGYQPGPYAPSEARCRDFLSWYLSSFETVLPIRSKLGSG